MDAETRNRWSTVAHGDRRLCSPVDGAWFSVLLETLALGHQPYAVDLGCGRGEALRLVIERYGGTATGADIQPRTLPDGIDFVLADAATWRPERPPDVALCIGATHIFGGAAATAAALTAMVRPGGVVIVGDGYWRSLPTDAQLAAFGMAADELTDLPGLVAGLPFPLAVQPSTETEWDDYEWSLIRAVERWADDHPADPDRDAFLARTHLMRDTYVEWRRRCMGFALAAAKSPTTRAPSG